MLIKLKRICENPKREDGKRILVDRIWPRGISKEDAKIDLWLKEIAPSNSLRKWFKHDPKRWEEFKIRYIKELKSKDLSAIISATKSGTVTLLFAAKDKKYNNAVVLKEYIQSLLSTSSTE